MVMKRLSIFTALLLVIFSVEAQSQQNTSLLQRDLFHQGEYGVNTYRIPALLETAHGVLIAVADARHDSSNDLPGHISLAMRRSFNQGADWDAPRTIQEAKEGGVGDASLLLDRATGRVWCFFTYGPPGIGFWNAEPGNVTGAKTLQIYAISSDDDGVTWSEPSDITPMVKKPSWRAVFATSGTDIQTSTGRFLLPLVVRDENSVIHSANAYSDDHGKSWKTGDLIGTGTDENHNVELNDGTILQNMRNGPTRSVAVSRDGGVTFGPVTHDPALIDPSCNAGFTHYRFALADLLVFTNAASTKRENLTVKLSYDGGKTWPIARVLNAGPSSYSTVLMLHDGRIAVLYESGSQYSAEKITFARFGLGWVKGAR